VDTFRVAEPNNLLYRFSFSHDWNGQCWLGGVMVAKDANWCNSWKAREHFGLLFSNETL